MQRRYGPSHLTAGRWEWEWEAHWFWITVDSLPSFPGNYDKLVRYTDSGIIWKNLQALLWFLCWCLRSSNTCDCCVDVYVCTCLCEVHACVHTHARLPGTTGLFWGSRKIYRWIKIPSSPWVFGLVSGFTTGRAIFNELTCPGHRPIKRNCGTWKRTVNSLRIINPVISDSVQLVTDDRKLFYVSLSGKSVKGLLQVHSSSPLCLECNGR